MFVNFWMRSLPWSATKTFPLASVATPLGQLNCPLPEPLLPHVVRKTGVSQGTVVEVVLDVEVEVELVVVVEDVVVVVGGCVVVEVVVVVGGG